MGVTMNDARPPEPVAGFTAADWAGDSAKRWASQADRLEAQLIPVSEVLFRSARLRAGEHVLDVGCGRGATTLDAARMVGRDGAVTGIDIAATLIDEARQFGASAPNVEFVIADAQRHDFDRAQFDVAISRFGVMFFDDAVAAFSKLRAAMRPGGRFVGAVWQTREKSDLMEVPLQIGVREVSKLGYAIELPPTDGGPFSLGDARYANSVLADAGWSNVQVELHDVVIHNGGPGTVEGALDVTFTIGPLRLLLSDLPESVTEQVRAALHEEFSARHDGIGVKFQAAIAILTAVAEHVPRYDERADRK